MVWGTRNSVLTEFQMLEISIQTQVSIPPKRKSLTKWMCPAGQDDWEIHVDLHVCMCWLTTEACEANTAAHVFVHSAFPSLSSDVGAQGYARTSGLEMPC